MVLLHDLWISFDSETLDEQDATEAATVQGKLEDLQQARRDFVMSVATIGGNAVKLAEGERPRYIYKWEYHEKKNTELKFCKLKRAVR